ncbi:cysteine hydrolase family protein [Mycoplasmopsis adleri]|uniref:cysteine hydrolase family protein n=1 Tax=Mycoplasmopsis adleri TaxID=51362 RepID=UPI00387372CC
MKNKIFVVDMLNGFCNMGALQSKEVATIIPNIASYLREHKNDSITFINDAHSKKDLEMKQYPVHCLKNTKEAEIVDELKPYVKDIIFKNSTNAFYYINIEELQNYNEIIIVGCCTDICIMQFALSLKVYFNKINLDKKVIVIKECVNTFNTNEHNYKEYNNFALNIMRNAGVEIQSWKKDM